MSTDVNDLDDFYGICFDGTRHAWEQGVAPVTYYVLDEISAELLISLQLAALSNVLVHNCVVNILIIWIVTKDGEVRFCVELGYPSGTPDRRFPHPRGLRADGVHALGHPMLCDDNKARIGGELYLDQLGGDLVWILSNKSGRYGASVDRIEDHLENVAVRFAEFGVNVETDYL